MSMSIKVEGEYVISLNDEDIPRLRVNSFIPECHHGQPFGRRRGPEIYSGKNAVGPLADPKHPSTTKDDL